MRTYYALIDEFYTLDLPGECKLENMRTLCVACHADVTKAQCAERRIARKKAKKQLKETISGLITSEKSGKNVLKVLVLTEISFSLSSPLLPSGEINYLLIDQSSIGWYKCFSAGYFEVWISSTAVDTWHAQIQLHIHTYIHTYYLLYVVSTFIFHRFCFLRSHILFFMTLIIIFFFFSPLLVWVGARALELGKI